MAYGGNNGNGNYTRPVFALIKMEVLWGINVAYARFASQKIKQFIKTLPQLPRKGYEPSYTGKGGFSLKLISLSIEDSLKTPEIEGPYPDW